MKARAVLGVLERLHRQLERRPGDQDHGAREGRRMAAADDSADRAFAADRRDLDRAAADSSTTIEIIVGPNGNRLDSTCSPRAQDDFAGLQLDQGAVRLEQGARLGCECRQQLIATEGRVGSG